MAETIVQEGKTLESTTVKIYRTATVVKGGRRFTFGALVAVGDRQGCVGIGYGKAPGVPAAIEKAQKSARRNLTRVTLKEGTLPHTVNARYGASMVRMVPASPGAGVIAGATVRTVLELAGVRDCLTKSFGSNNQKNLLKATYKGLQSLRSKEEIAQLRGVTIEPTDVERRLEAGRRFTASAGAPKTETAVQESAKPTSKPSAVPQATSGQAQQAPASSESHPTRVVSDGAAPRGTPQASNGGAPDKKADEPTSTTSSPESAPDSSPDNVSGGDESPKPPTND